jgi:[ribosomal protein S18]-alanine N-acetyltransferase
MIRPATEDERRAVAPVWADGGYPVLIAVADGAVAGYCVYRALGDREFELLFIEVYEPFRRRGLARELLGALPGGRVFLEVRASNEGARALYMATGFQAVGLRKRYYQDTGEDGIVMDREKW